MKRLCSVLFCLLVFSSGIAWAEVVIIVHQTVPETTLNKEDVQQIFLGKRVQWSDNSPIHAVILKETALHKAFLKDYLGKSFTKWNAHWKRMVFTGNGTPPKQCKTQQKLVEYVAATAGAIGYVDAATPAENVTIIEVK